MRDLRERSRVRLASDKARVLIGVMDEMGILESGQVYIRISPFLDRPGIDTRVITKKIAIMKNPCIHPGDVRVLQGTDVPELSHLVDCVVFPSKGPRPHPNELSGSDLDGDQYHCIWDDKLMPVLPLVEPMDYQGGERREEEEPIGVRHMVDHVCDVIGHDSLGMIDNTHKALADQQGLESDVCLKLAELHSLQVDANKTGNWQTLPPEIMAELRLYPDFMMKTDKPSYSSSNVLGKMFRECNKFMRDTSTSSGGAELLGIRVDRALEAEGFERYVQDAQEHFRTYNAEILRIMRMYGIQTEGELVSRAISSVHPRLKDEMNDVQKTVKRLMEDLTRRYREIFNSDERLGEHDRAKEEAKKAVAWYYVAYSRSYGQTYVVGKADLTWDTVVIDVFSSRQRRDALPELPVGPQ